MILWTQEQGEAGDLSLLLWPQGAEDGLKFFILLPSAFVALTGVHLLVFCSLFLVNWDLSEKPGPGCSGMLLSHLWLQMAEAGHCLCVATFRCLMVTTPPSFSTKLSSLSSLWRKLQSRHRRADPVVYLSQNFVFWCSVLLLCPTKTGSPVFCSSFLLLVF